MNRILSLLLLAFLPSLAWAQDVAPVACCGAQEEAKGDAPKHGRGYVHPSKAELAKLHADAYKRHGHRQHYLVRAMTAPAAFDSRTMGWIPPIRDQGNCGDCFGVEASDALTIAFIKQGYQKADGSFVISEQVGLDCRYYQGGCNGGDGPQVYGVMKDKGFPAEKYVDESGNTVIDYPSYTARAASCRLKAGAKLWKCTDWGYVTSDQSDRAPTVDEVKAGVLKYACVTFAFDAGGLSGMVNNVVRSLGNSIDHEITGFMGWDDNKACPDGTKGAFLCRNQWGSGFGDGGYFWLPYSQLRHVVEACFLTVAQLPPPPPPPVDLKPVITSTLASNAVTGQPWTYQITATNSPTSYATPGNSFIVSATGLVSGTVKTAGSYNVPITATNASGTGTATLALTVTDKPVPPPVPIGVEITISKDLKAGKYEIHPAGTKAKLDAWEAWWQSRPSAPQADKLAPMPKESSGITANDIRIIAARVAEFERRVDLLLASVP